MALTAGTNVGPYEILALIGAGGMGEVYRARDSKLGRDIALKVLPEAFARDAERMARFQREAKVLASLNHPDIASIYGLEDSGATHALVMELVEGPTLAGRIRSGAIPIDEALSIAKQITEALEYAHERGIVHRDLKPANVKVTNDDAVKVLDFGLAKAIEGDAASTDMANSPTLSRMATQAGVLLGTAAYMSPEQAKAKAVDRRTDIWAFGCVLFEMLTAKMVFQGETVTDTLAAVIKEEPDWSQLPAGTPIRVRVLLQSCLQKDPKQRLRDIGDARIALEDVLSGARDPTSVTTTARPAKRWSSWVLGGIAVVAVLATALMAFLYLHRKPIATGAVRFEIPLPEKTTFTGGAPSISPDGRSLAFVATGADGLSRLWVRSLETVDARSLEGTEGANGWPFWSPDSTYIAFAARGKLMKVQVSGGPPQELCDAGLVLGGAWASDGKLIFASGSALLQLNEAGGAPSPIAGIRRAGFPTLLPDGRHVIYSVGPPGSVGSGIYVGSLDASSSDQLPARLMADTSAVDYVPSSDSALGYLLFLRNGTTPDSAGTLMAIRFDWERLKLVGEAFPVADRVSDFSASANGVLVYWSGSSVATGPTRGNIQGQLTWFGRQGKVLGTFGDPGLYRTLALSPDGKRVAFERADSGNPINRNIWLYDFDRGVSTRFTFNSAWDGGPVWSPDGSHVAFTSNRDTEFDLYQKASNLAGEDELLFRSPNNKVPTSWSPDGRFLLYYYATPPSEVWALPLAGGPADRKPISVARSEFNEAIGHFSPDGRWVAYESNESGRDEIYVRPFDPPSSAPGTSSATGTSVTGKWMVSKSGGGSPLWRRDGKELFYLSGDGMAMAVDVSTNGVFQSGVPKALFKVPTGVLFWDVSPDGKRFLMPAPAAARGASPFTVVLNWQAGLKK
jgi:eukaryotic-like serine/threonine-protein kinase